MKYEIKTLSNQLAFISGASGHLGEEIVKGLIKHGCKVIANGRNFYKLNRLKKKFKKNKLLEIANFDITNESEVAKFFKNIKKLNILINNACDVYPNHKGLFDGNIFNYYNNLIVNGSNLLLKYSIKKLLLGKNINDNASIINISSIYGVVSPRTWLYSSRFYNHPSYCASKAALIQLTKYYAVKFATKGVRVNSLSPGPFPTKENQFNNIKIMKKIKENIPMKRFGKSDEIIGPVIFLASKESSYVTGTNIFVDGGWTAV